MSRCAFRSSRGTGGGLDALADKLQKAGWLGLGSGGRMLEHARGMALIGMLCSIDPHRSYLEPAFAARGLVLDETIACMKAAHAEHGFPPLPYDVDGSVYSTL